MNANTKWRAWLLGGVAAMVGCSTTNNTIAPCGAGTTLHDGVCVAVEGGVSVDGSANPDASADSAVPADATTDGTTARPDSAIGDVASDSPTSADDPWRRHDDSNVRPAPKLESYRHPIGRTLADGAWF